MSKTLWSSQKSTALYFLVKVALLQFCLVTRTAGRPGNGLQPLFGYWLSINQATTIGPILNTFKSILYLGQKSLIIHQDRLLLLHFQEIYRHLLEVLRILLDGVERCGMGLR